MMTNVMMKTCLNQKIIKISNLIQAVKNSVCPKAKVMRRRRSFLAPNVPKCGLNTRHDNREVALSATLWNAPPVQFWLTNCSAQLYVPAAIHLRSNDAHYNANDILKNMMMTNVMMKTCLNQKIIKISNLIQAVKNSVCPKAKVMRRRNFSESRICPNIYRMFRSVDWTHDMIIVKWHLFIWHERKLCALTNAPPVISTQMGQWLSTLFHANCSAAQVYVLYPRQFIFAPSCRRRPFLQVLQSTER